MLLLLLLLPLPGRPVCCSAPNPEVPLPVEDALLEPKPLLDPDDEPEELLEFNESRSAALELELRPDPGASWLSALSSEEPEPPMNISVRTFAIC